ncbi:DNA-binding transcriptional regulator YhcF (GntR family) [Crossiella equi]|uniref:DNA-binding transcriptional regulator YhcF (GntR family) n=1 Tax=Crossiella equi TaxID=130796 RepID=A0ABS5A868_9PSEU|nr:TetR/AcrR family transcriptional regulator C-terminal domain-containing protein [Crossiella equi]MBP2472788.1 DNA-binding transcriptional regulator YhcF (GntR family) [Crossiella equi]
MPDDLPPYRRIAESIAARITTGELRPGARVPSTREITRTWGVAMATATKALDFLRREGWVDTHPGAGTVVRSREGTRKPLPAEGTLTRSRITRAAITLADREGVDAVTMRRLAQHLGVGPMSLYRHLAGKDELVHLMMRKAFRTATLPSTPRGNWRARLTLVCQTQWRLYRRHPWLPDLISITRPLLIPEGMAHSEWTMAALAGLGLTPAEATREALLLAAFIRGLALSERAEKANAFQSGLNHTEWWQAHQAETAALFATGAYPHLATIPDGVAGDLDSLFDQGLTRHLDGLAARLAGLRGE